MTRRGGGAGEFRILDDARERGGGGLVYGQGPAAKVDTARAGERTNCLRVGVELKETAEERALEEVTPDGFRSSLEKYFVLRAVVRGRDNREFQTRKLCSSDSAKALLYAGS